MNKTTTVACVAWDVLLTNHMSGTRDPVAFVSGTVAEDVMVDVLSCRQHSFVCVVPLKLDLVKNRLFAAG